MRKFRFVAFSASSYWLWFDFNDRCAICRNDLKEPSISYQVGENCREYNISHQEDCKIIGMGVCKHSFHLDCIERWLTRHNRCPICVRKWKYFKLAVLEQSDN